VQGTVVAQVCVPAVQKPRAVRQFPRPARAVALLAHSARFGRKTRSAHERALL
jgi:hypothetical protein